MLVSKVRAVSEMRRRTYLTIVCLTMPFVAEFGMPSSEARAGIIYGSRTDSSDLFLTIDPSSGAGTDVGPLGFDQVAGLGFDPNTNTLYGSDINSDQLLTIDTSTGAATAIGSLGFANVEGLAFDANTNTLFGHDNTAVLLTINTVTGAATSVGALGFAGVRGLAFDPNSDTLYGGNAQTGELVTINTATGVGTVVGSIGIGGALNGLAYDPITDTLFGSMSNTSQLVSINTSTGAGAVVGSVGSPFVTGLAFNSAAVPESSSLVLLSLGAITLLGLRKRKANRTHK